MSTEIQQIRATVKSLGRYTEDNSGGSSMVVFEEVELVDAAGVGTRLRGVLVFGHPARLIYRGGELDLLLATGIPAGKANPWGGWQMSVVYLAKAPEDATWSGERDIEELRRIPGDILKSEIIGYPVAAFCFISVLLAFFGFKLVSDLVKGRRMANAMPTRHQIDAAVARAKEWLARQPRATAAPAPKPQRAPAAVELQHDMVA